VKTDEQIASILKGLGEAIQDPAVPVFLSPLLMSARQALSQHAAVWKDPAAMQVNLLHTGILTRDNALHIAGATDYDAIKAERDALLAAIEPFAKAAEKADATAKETEQLLRTKFSDGMSPGWGINYGHVKAAREAFAKATQS
jgi:hypothetical protein